MQSNSVVQIADQSQFNLNAGNITRPLVLSNTSNLLRMISMKAEKSHTMT